MYDQFNDLPVWVHRDTNETLYDKPTNILTYPDMPKSLLVIGSGAIGIEFASFYNTFGVNVTVVEMADRILNSVELIKPKE